MKLSLSLILAASVLTACAHAPEAGTAASTRYQGRYESGCATLVEGSLYAVDVLILQPQDANTVSVGMRKAFYSVDGCAADTQIGSLVVPSGQWLLQGKLKVGERSADKVTVNLPAGPIQVLNEPKAKAKGHIELAGDTIHVHHGKGLKLSLGSQSAAGSDKDLRWVDKGSLLQGETDHLGPDGYPTALNEDYLFNLQR